MSARTIESILEYHLSEHEKTCLFQCWIINGIGGEGQNIEDILMQNICLVDGFDTSRAEALINDIRKIADEHDIDFRLKLWFYKANYKFSKKLFHLLHWTSKRLAIALICFIILNRYGKKFYVIKK